MGREKRGSSSALQQVRIDVLITAQTARNTSRHMAADLDVAVAADPPLWSCCSGRDPLDAGETPCSRAQAGVQNLLVPRFLDRCTPYC